MAAPGMSRAKRFWSLAAAMIAAGGIAAYVARLRAKREHPHVRGDELTRVDEAGVDSFPASDPPGWTLGVDRDPADQTP